MMKAAHTLKNKGMQDATVYDLFQTSLAYGSFKLWPHFAEFALGVSLRCDACPCASSSPTSIHLLRSPLQSPLYAKALKRCEFLVVPVDVFGALGQPLRAIQKTVPVFKLPDLVCAGSRVWAHLRLQASGWFRFDFD